MVAVAAMVAAVAGTRHRTTTPILTAVAFVPMREKEVSHPGTRAVVFACVFALAVLQLWLHFGLCLDCELRRTESCLLPVGCSPPKTSCKWAGPPLARTAAIVP